MSNPDCKNQRRGLFSKFSDYAVTLDYSRNELNVHAPTNTKSHSSHHYKKFHTRHVNFSIDTTMDLSKNLICICYPSISHSGLHILEIYSSKNLGFRRKYVIPALPIFIKIVSESKTSKYNQFNRLLKEFSGIVALFLDDGTVWLCDLKLSGCSNCEDSVCFTSDESHYCSILDISKEPNHFTLTEETDATFNVPYHSSILLYDCKKIHNSSFIPVTCAEYFDNIQIFAVGFTDSRFILFSLTSLEPILEYKFPDDLHPISSFFVQEPDDDPIPCVYLWVSRNISPSDDGCSNQAEVLCLFHLLFESRRSYAHNFNLFTNFVGYEKRISATSTFFESISNLQQRFNLQGIEIRLQPLVYHKQYKCTMVVIWSLYVKDQVRNFTSTKSFMGIFDLNKWYRDILENNSSSLLNSDITAINEISLPTEKNAVKSPMMDVKITWLFCTNISGKNNQFKLPPGCTSAFIVNVLDENGITSFLVPSKNTPTTVFCSDRIDKMTTSEENLPSLSPGPCEKTDLYFEEIRSNIMKIFDYFIDIVNETFCNNTLCPSLTALQEYRSKLHFVVQIVNSLRKLISKPHLERNTVARRLLSQSVAICRFSALFVLMLQLWNDYSPSCRWDISKKIVKNSSNKSLRMFESLIGSCRIHLKNQDLAILSGFTHSSMSIEDILSLILLPLEEKDHLHLDLVLYCLMDLEKNSEIYYHSKLAEQAAQIFQVKDCNFQLISYFWNTDQADQRASLSHLCNFLNLAEPKDVIPYYIIPEEEHLIFQILLQIGSVDMIILCISLFIKKRRISECLLDVLVEYFAEFKFDLEMCLAVKQLVEFHTPILKLTELLKEKIVYSNYRFVRFLLRHLNLLLSNVSLSVESLHSESNPNEVDIHRMSIPMVELSTNLLKNGFYKKNEDRISSRESFKWFYNLKFPSVSTFARNLIVQQSYNLTFPLQKFQHSSENIFHSTKKVINNFLNIFQGTEKITSNLITESLPPLNFKNNSLQTKYTKNHIPLIDYFQKKRILKSTKSKRRQNFTSFNDKLPVSQQVTKPITPILKRTFDSSITSFNIDSPTSYPPLESNFPRKRICFDIHESEESTQTVKEDVGKTSNTDANCHQDDQQVIDLIQEQTEINSVHTSMDIEDEGQFTENPVQSHCEKSPNNTKVNFNLSNEVIDACIIEETAVSASLELNHREIDVFNLSAIEPYEQFSERLIDSIRMNIPSSPVQNIEIKTHDQGIDNIDDIPQSEPLKHVSSIHCQVPTSNTNSTQTVDQTIATIEPSQEIELKPSNIEKTKRRRGRPPLKNKSESNSTISSFPDTSEASVSSVALESSVSALDASMIGASDLSMSDISNLSNNSLNSSKRKSKRGKYGIIPIRTYGRRLPVSPENSQEFQSPRRSERIKKLYKK